jgi:hypothetical protein
MVMKEIDMNNNSLLARKNFTVEADFRDKINDSTEVRLATHMEELALKLAAKNPSWRFELRQSWSDFTNESTAKVFNTFRIKDSEGRELGRVGSDYRYTAQGKVYCYLIANKRFPRGNKKTASLATAMREIQKAFRADTTKELISNAMSNFDDVQRNQIHHRRYELRDAQRQLKEAMQRFVVTQQFEAFLEYCETSDQTGNNAVTANAKLEMEIKTIEDIQQKFDTHKTCLLIRHADSWILRIDDDVKMCNDSSLPKDTRMKLGMLKLVDKEQFIENVGCKVNDYTFVITLE